MDGSLAASDRQILPSEQGRKYRLGNFCVIPSISVVQQPENKKRRAGGRPQGALLRRPVLRSFSEGGGYGATSSAALHGYLEHLRLGSANRAVITVSLDRISTGFQDCAFQR